MSYSPCETESSCERTPLSVSGRGGFLPLGNRRLGRQPSPYRMSSDGLLLPVTPASCHQLHRRDGDAWRQDSRRPAKPLAKTVAPQICNPSLISTARSTRVMPASILPRLVDNRHRYCGRWLYGRLFVKCISLSLRRGVGRENDSFSRRQQFNMLRYFVFPRFP